MKLDKLSNGSGFIIPTIRKRGYLIQNNGGSALVVLEDGTNRKRTTISLGTEIKKSAKVTKYFESLGYSKDTTDLKTNIIIYSKDTKEE